MLRFIRLLLNAVDFFCVYSFIVRYNSLNSFLSFPHLSLPLSRRRQRNSLLLGGKILQKQKNRQQDFFCCCCSFPLGFYCAIETDLHAFNFYLVTSSLHLPVPLLCCSLPVYYYYFVVRPGFFFFSSFTQSVARATFDCHYKSNKFPFYICTLDNRQLFNEFEHSFILSNCSQLKCYLLGCCEASNEKQIAGEKSESINSNRNTLRDRYRKMCFFTSSMDL